MSSLADFPELVGFFSYSRDDDKAFRRSLSTLREAVGSELAARLGRSEKNFRLWQDQEAIAWGDLWESEITKAIEQSAFFIPIITPRAVASKNCKFEFNSFLARQSALGRDDLVFPILYLPIPDLEEEPKWRNDTLLSIVGKRQYTDWQSLRHLSRGTREFEEAIDKFCGQIVAKLRKPWISPEERSRLAEEARRRAEEEERARQEAEAKRQADEAEAERRREEADARRRQASELGREVEAQRQESEAKTRPDDEERRRQDAEAKMRAEDEERVSIPIQRPSVITRKLFSFRQSSKPGLINTTEEFASRLGHMIMEVQQDASESDYLRIMAYAPLPSFLFEKANTYRRLLDMLFHPNSRVELVCLDERSFGNWTEKFRGKILTRGGERYTSSIPSFYVIPKASANVAFWWMSSAYRSMSGRRRTSGIFGMRS